MKKLARVIPFALGLTPFLAIAGTLIDILGKLKELADAIVPLFMVIAVAVFLWGIIKYITAGGSPEKEKAARGFIIYGLIGIFVLVAFWGIIRILTTSFGIDLGGSQELPSVIPGKVK